MITFFVPGKPQAKQRPFFSRKTGVAFTRKETVNYENLVKMCCYEAMDDKRIPLDGPLTVTINIFLARPKSKPKWWVDAEDKGLIGATVTPDLDNVAKSITDALNDIAYHDDKQIVELIINKSYADPLAGVEVGAQVAIDHHRSYRFPHDITKKEFDAAK